MVTYQALGLQGHSVKRIRALSVSVDDENLKNSHLSNKQQFLHGAMLATYLTPGTVSGNCPNRPPSTDWGLFISLIQLSLPP